MAPRNSNDGGNITTDRGQESNTDKTSGTHEPTGAGDEPGSKFDEPTGAGDKTGSNFDESTTSQASEYEDAEETLPEEEGQDSESEEETTLREEETEQRIPQQTPQRVSQRSTKGIPPEKYCPTGCSTGAREKDPNTFNEAMNSRNHNDWIKAMNEEISMIKKLDTWEEVQLPHGRKTIGCRWVFTTKYHENGSIRERKARLVAQGFAQKHGLDYNDVFAPVARSTTLRILLSVSGKRNYIVNHLDVKSAFLNADLKEEIYMRHPPGSRKTGTVLKLKKSLYGLKQAAYTWNQKLHNVLTRMGFIQSTADNCLYVKRNGGKIVYILVHVDDMLVATNSQTALEITEAQLRNHFELKNLGGVTQFLGIDIARTDGKIFISQSPFIDSIVEEAQLQDAKESRHPLDTGYFKAEQTATPEQLRELESNEEYRRLIGMLLYLVTNTRPDVAASVAILSKRVENPRQMDLTEVKRVIRYLKGTRNLQLELNNKKKPQDLVAYSDANWAEDTLDRKSTSGHYCSLNGGTISWFSRKQKLIALSSCEAEYIALAETCKEITWIKQVIKEFDIEINPVTTVFTDSQSAIALVENDKQAGRTKHMDIRYHYVKEEFKLGNVKLTYVTTEANIADMFTKPLGGKKIEELRQLAGLRG